MDSAEKNFKQTSNMLKALIDTINKWLKNVGESLELRARYAPYRELGKWLSKNGGSIYEVHGSCATELRMELQKRGIPFIQDVNNDKRFIIKQPDLEIIRELNRQILVAKSNYYQEVDAHEMEDAISRFDGIKDKEIFTLHNLNYYQMEVLKNKFNDISQGFMVGISNGDYPNTYNLSVHAAKMLDMDGTKMDLCKAYLAASFSLYGINSSIKYAQIDADRQMDRNIASIKGDSRSYYIVGADDMSKFIELNGNGFEYYQRTMVDGEVFEQEVARCDINSIDFDVELQRHLDKIKNKVILHSNEELSSHFSTDTRNINLERPEKTYEQEQVSIAEDLIVEKMDTMIKSKLSTFDANFHTSEEKFRYYQRESYSIMESVITGTANDRYKQEDIEKIKNIFSERGVETSRYSNVREPLAHFNCECHNAQKLSREVKKERQVEYGNTNR